MEAGDAAGAEARVGRAVRIDPRHRRVAFHPAGEQDPSLVVEHHVFPFPGRHRDPAAAGEFGVDGPVGEQADEEGAAFLGFGFAGFDFGRGVAFLRGGEQEHPARPVDRDVLADEQFPARGLEADGAAVAKGRDRGAGTPGKRGVRVFLRRGHADEREGRRRQRGKGQD